MSASRDQLAVGVVNGILYAIGGENGGVFTNKVEAYNPMTDTWTNVSPLNTPCGNAGVGVINGSLYVAGGYNNIANTQISTNEAFVPLYIYQPAILTSPTNITVSSGGTIALTVNATGGSLSYQWLLNGTNIAGATSPTLTLTNLDAMAAGTYSVIITNLAGAVTNSLYTISLLDLGMYAGLTIVGQVGGNYEIDYWNDLDTNATVLTNLTLPSSPYLFIDTTSPFYSKRFYHVTLQP